jgi:hypothetical protein
MHPESEIEAAATPSPWTGADVAAVLRERSWLGLGPAPEIEVWLVDAAALLGPHAPDRPTLEDLLRLIFHYDAREILALGESHAVLARSGAREVIRELGNRILAGPEIDSDRFKAIASELKNKLSYRGRELFHPLRLALAGRPGEGELDRVILLLDRAAKLGFCTPVKGTKQRMLEFCATLD